MDRKEQLSNKQIFELAKKAYENNEMVDFLSGENGYECPVNRFVPANVPTDINKIIKCGIYPLYNEKQNKEIVILYKEGILQLIDGDPIHVWIGYSVCWSQIYYEQTSISPFSLVTFDLIDSVKKALNNNKEELKTITEWQGIGEEEGLWQDIIRTNNVLVKKFGLSIL